MSSRLLGVILIICTIIQTIIEMRPALANSPDTLDSFSHLIGGIGGVWGVLGLITLNVLGANAVV